MKPFIMAVLASYAALANSTSAAEIKEFDGNWSATIKPNITQNCALGGSVIRHDFTVRQGHIDGTIKAGFGVHKLTGLVQSDGSVNDFAMVGLIPWSFAGKFEKDSAFGKFQGKTCSGKFRFLRTGGP